MDLSNMISIISLILSIIIGTIGTMMMVSLNKRILSAIGLEKFPKDPEEKYTLLAEHCKFLGHWTNFDRFNLYLLIVGVLFLIGAAGITIYNLDTEGKPFLNQIQLGLLINSFAWIFLSFSLLVLRFVQVINIYKYTVKNR